MKSFKAMISEVAQPEPAEEKAFKAQHTVVADKHPVALETQHKGTKPKAKRKADQEGDANYDLAYESTDLTEEPKEEIPMMMNQLAFICYAAEEISGMIKINSDPEEWFQNKLAATHSEMKTLYSYMQGQNQMDYMNMGYADDMDEELSPKQKKIDHNKNNKIDGEDLAMIRAKKNEGFASDAQRKAIWASKNEKGVKEELKGDQHKIDKNKNGKIDKHDFKLLNKESLDELKQSIFNAYVVEGRGDAVLKTNAKHADDNDRHVETLKKAGLHASQGAGAGNHIIVPREHETKARKLLAAHLKEAEQKPASPFDLKNYKSQIPTKAGEKAGFDSKKVSTGTVYSRKSVKEAAYEKDMDEKKKVIVKGVKGMKSTPFTKTFRNMAAYDKWSDSDAAGDYEVQHVMHEEVELDEAFQQGIVKFKDGSSSVLKKEDADILNKLMGGMSSGSVKKMTETAMKDKTGFAEILAFAKEAM
jgi:hypothetical protein